MASPISGSSSFLHTFKYASEALSKPLTEFFNSMLLKHGAPKERTLQELERVRFTNTVQDDPLSARTKGLIYRFVREHLQTEDGQLIRHPSQDRSKALKDLSKTYNLVDDSYARTVDAYHRSHAHPERTLQWLHNVVKQPQLANETLQLDPTNQQQIYAARIFMKAVICNPMASFEQVQLSYVKKMTKTTEAVGSHPILPKHKLLMEKPLSDLPADARAIDILMANTHVVECLGEDQAERESALSSIREEFSALLRNPETAHVMYALALLIHQQKGNIFLSNESDKLRTIGSHTVLANSSGFSTHHSIYSTRNISPGYGRTFNSVFIHEASHHIFRELVKNNTSPVSGGELESKLDEALSQDRVHRETKRSSYIGHPGWKETYHILVTQLESHPGYFPPTGFNASNPDHLHKMRVEAIVRIMQQIAVGVPLKTIQRVAPNLCEFYFRYSKPMIERYITENLADLPGVDQSKVVSGTHDQDLRVLREEDLIEDHHETAMPAIDIDTMLADLTALYGNQVAPILGIGSH